jgi:hypothetical protein
MDSIYNYLPGHGDILRLQRHSKIAEICVHYYKIRGGGAEVMCGLDKVESINLSVISIHATYSPWAAAQSAKIAHGA